MAIVSVHGVSRAKILEAVNVLLPGEDGLQVEYMTLTPYAVHVTYFQVDDEGHKIIGSNHEPVTAYISYPVVD